MRGARAVALFLVLLSLVLAPLREAAACGAFAARRPTEGELAARLPYLTVEQVLLVWDEETGTEDFIREARFDRADQAFGFVVPTPTKPEVAAVAHAPFDALRKAYPFEPPDAPTGGAGIGAVGKGAGAGAAPPPVVVLSEQRIGSFTAFTLSATDAGAFDRWLEENGFAMTPEAKPWLAHYVALKFFFVAFRYEPKDDAGAATPGMTSETVRIRFHTPNPYYPYMEPIHPHFGAEPSKERMLTGWLVTRKPMLPVAARTRNGYRWARPWTNGTRQTPTLEALSSVVGDLRSILPKSTGSLVVQPFRDLKGSREGFGDVLLVPADGEPVDAERSNARRFLLPVIDPSLLEEDTKTGEVDAAVVDSGSSIASPPPAPSAAPPSAKSCSVTVPGAEASGSWDAGCIALALALVVARRRALLAPSLALVLASTSSCGRTAPNSGDASADGSAASGKTSAPAPEVLPSREIREQAALEILGGRTPPESARLNRGSWIAPDQQPGPRRPAVPGEVVLEAPRVTGGQVPDAARVVAGLRPRMRQCYGVGLDLRPTMKGKLTITAKVASNGAVSSADVTANTGIISAVAACCAAAVRRAQFTVDGDKDVSIAFSMTFEPKK
jgi:hypothetical protein